MRLSLPLAGDGILHYAESTIQAGQLLEMGGERARRFSQTQPRAAGVGDGHVDPDPDF